MKQYWRYNTSSARFRYFNSTFSLCILMQITLHYCAVGRGDVTTSIDVGRYAANIYIIVTTLHAMQGMPKLGHVFIYMRKTISDLMTFGPIIVGITLVFSRLEMIFVNTNSTEGCVGAFSNLLASTYTLYLTLINAQDYTRFQVKSEQILLTQHILYVYLVGIMLYNMLIAISNDTVEKIYKDRRLITDIERITVQTEMNVNVQRTPLWGAILSNRSYRHLIEKQFVCSDERIYLVAIKPNVRFCE